MNFSPNCRTKKLVMISTILGSVHSFLNLEGANIQPQIRPRKIPVNLFRVLVVYLCTQRVPIEDSDQIAWICRLI